MTLWPGKPVVALLLVSAFVNWDHVGGKTVRLVDPEFLHNYGQIRTDESRLLFSREGRSPQEQDNENIQICNKRLLDTLTTVCRNSEQISNSIPSSQRRLIRSLPQLQKQQDFSMTSDLRAVSESDNVGVADVKDVVYYNNKIPRNVVDECCYNKCSMSQFLKYCVHFRPEGSVQPVTTPTITTITTPIPPTAPFRNHRFGKTRENVIGLALGGFLTNYSSQFPTDQPDIPQQLIQDTIQCLLNPNCANRDDFKIPEGSEFPRNRKNRITKPFSKENCNSGLKNRTTKGRRFHRRRKQEEPSRLIHVLLDWLTWGVQKNRKVVQPQPQPFQGPDLNTLVVNDPAGWDHRYRNQNVNSHRGGPSSSTSLSNPNPHHQYASTFGGGTGGSSSFPSDPYHVNNTPGGSRTYSSQFSKPQSYPHSYVNEQTEPRREAYQPPNFQAPEDEDSYKMIVVTDAPIRASIGFPRGTYDGISYSH